MFPFNFLNRVSILHINSLKVKITDIWLEVHDHLYLKVYKKMELRSQREAGIFPLSPVFLMLFSLSGDVSV